MIKLQKKKAQNYSKTRKKNKNFIREKMQKKSIIAKYSRQLNFCFDRLIFGFRKCNVLFTMWKSTPREFERSMF